MYEPESAQRGYLFTKRTLYYEPFNKALNKALNKELNKARDNIEKIESLVISTSIGKAANRT